MYVGSTCFARPDKPFSSKRHRFKQRKDWHIIFLVALPSWERKVLCTSPPSLSQSEETDSSIMIFMRDEPLEPHRMYRVAKLHSKDRRFALRSIPERFATAAVVFKPKVSEKRNIFHESENQKPADFTASGGGEGRVGNRLRKSSPFHWLTHG